MMIKSTVAESNIIIFAHLYKMMMLTGISVMLVITEGMYFLIFMANPIWTKKCAVRARKKPYQIEKSMLLGK